MSSKQPGLDLPGSIHAIILLRKFLSIKAKESKQPGLDLPGSTHAIVNLEKISKYKTI